MMKVFLYVVTLSLMASFAVAGNLSFQQKTELKNRGYSDSDIVEIELGNPYVEPTYKYESLSGNRYKYDLTDPADRIEYSVDPGAQIDDQVNPMVDIDRGLGQYGGGIQTD